MQLPPFRSPSRELTRTMQRFFPAREDRFPRITECRTLDPECYVAYLKMPLGATVLGYELPLVGDLIPVTEGFDYYPGRAFWMASQETLTFHLAVKTTTWTLHLELVPPVFHHGSTH